MPEDEETQGEDLELETQDEAQEEQQQQDQEQATETADAAPAEPTEEEVAALAAKYGFVKPEAKPEPKQETLAQPQTLEQRAKIALINAGGDPDDWDQLENAKEFVRKEDFRAVAREEAINASRVTLTKDNLSKTYGADAAQEFESILASTNVGFTPEAISMLEDMAIGRATRKNQGKPAQTPVQRTVTQTVTTDSFAYADASTKAADAEYDRYFGQGAAAKRRMGK